MSTTIQQLFHKWARVAPDECLSTERDYKFKLRILPDVERCNSLTASRQIITENLETHLANRRDLTIQLLNFVLLTIIQHCAARQSSISFSFTELGTIATICNGLRSQPHPHPALAALDAYVQVKASQGESVGCLYQYLETKKLKPVLPDDAPIAIVLFAGGGGIEAGMVEAGIRPIIAVE